MVFPEIPATLFAFEICNAMSKNARHCERTDMVRTDENSCSAIWWNTVPMRNAHPTYAQIIFGSTLLTARFPVDSIALALWSIMIASKNAQREYHRDRKYESTPVSFE